MVHKHLYVEYIRQLYGPINKFHQKLYIRLNNFYSNNGFAAPTAGFIAANISGIAAHNNLS